MFAREELGRYLILLDLWKRAEEGKPPAVDEVRAACDDHVEKQRRAQLSISYRGEGSGGLANLIRARMQYKPGSPEYEQAVEAMEKLNEIKAKRRPTDRHSTRMRALYVDLDDSGIGWNRPSEMSRAEATNCLADAVNDYARAYDRLTRGVGLDPNLSAALDAWWERPELPPPAWPEFFYGVRATRLFF